jgi:hypothetical protein
LEYEPRIKLAVAPSEMPNTADPQEITPSKRTIRIGQRVSTFVRVR